LLKNQNLTQVLKLSNINKIITVKEKGYKYTAKYCFCAYLS